MKLHQEDKEQIVSLHLEGVPSKTIAEQYGVTVCTVNAAIRKELGPRLSRNTDLVMQLADKGVPTPEIAKRIGKSAHYVHNVLYKGRIARVEAETAELLKSVQKPDFSRKTEPEDLEEYEQHVMWLLEYVSSLDPLSPLLQEKLKQIRIRQIISK